MPNAVTATDLFLEEISGKLDRIIGLLEPPREQSTVDAPVTGEPEPEPAAKKTAAKKATARKRVTGQ